MEKRYKHDSSSNKKLWFNKRFFKIAKKKVMQLFCRMSGTIQLGK